MVPELCFPTLVQNLKSEEKKNLPSLMWESGGSTRKKEHCCHCIPMLAIVKTPTRYLSQVLHIYGMKGTDFLLVVKSSGFLSYHSNKPQLLVCWSLGAIRGFLLGQCGK